MIRAWAYYNENDLYCVKWLRNLIKRKLIADGDVDPRPIERVKPDDLKGFGQCHFFAGLGGWAGALRLAGWPDERRIWTGSCPCQPFSVAGKRKGTADKRHLWPHFHRLISAARPPVVMGEQVAGKAGYEWLLGVGSDLEKERYGWRAVDIPACSVNAPHRRNRLYWVAHTEKQPERESEHEVGAESRGDARADAGGSESGSSGLVHSDDPKRRAGKPQGNDDHGTETRWDEGDGDPRGSGGATGGLGNSERQRDADARRGAAQEAQGGVQGAHGEWERIRSDAGESDHGIGFWDDYTLVGPDPKGKYRRVKPGVCLLASRVPARVAKLRALGNAIVPELAAEVIRAYLDSKGTL